MKQLYSYIDRKKPKILNTQMYKQHTSWMLENIEYPNQNTPLYANKHK